MGSIQVGASFAKRLFPEVGPLGSTSLRLVFATLILLGLWRPWRRKWKSDQLQTLALYGVSLGCMNLLFYFALERTPLGIAVALEFVGPLAVALFASRRRLDFLWAALAACGILLIVPMHQDSVKNLSIEGVIFALGAGICWALYILFGKKVGRDIPSGQATALGMFFATLVVLPIGIIFKGTQLLRPELFPWALGVAILSSALPYSLEMSALKKLPHKTFSILMSLEPALAALSGLIFLNESLSITQWVAIALVIAASAGTCLTEAP